MNNLLDSQDAFFEFAIAKANEGLWATAARMFRYAANENNREALYQLGKLYLHGLGVEKNQELAIALLMRAANSGVVAANFELARVLYESERYEQARPHLETSLQHGNPTAAFMLGWMCLSGLASEKNETKAVGYFEVAAQGGFDVAQYNLAYCYINGVGVEADLDRGVQWLKKAAYQQYPKALQALQEIASKAPELVEISAEEIGSMLVAQRIADKYLAKELDFESYLKAIEESTVGERSEWLEAALQYWRARHEGKGL